MKQLSALFISLLPVLLLALAVSALTVSIQAKTLEQQFTKKLKTKPREQFMTLTVENDLFGSGDDRNYTNGVRLGWFDTNAVAPAAARIIDPLIPMFSVNDTTSVHYSLGQNLYAPRNLLAKTPNPKDRPYAGFIYGSMGLTSITDNHLDDIELTVGMIGSAALGEQTQKFVHNLINSDDPKGWDHQLKNEPALMASWQRLWPEAYTAEIGNLHFRTSPYGGATLGNVYTYANSGVMLQLVPKDSKWQGMPLRVRPAMPGSGYFSVPENEFSWSVFAGLEGRALARNIFLDGNSFRDSPSVDKKLFVGDANIGLAFAYGKTQISYTLNYRSEEFHGQDGSDLFGAVSLGHRF